MIRYKQPEVRQFRGFLFHNMTDAFNAGRELLQNKYSDSSFGSAMLAGIAMGIWNSGEVALKRCNEIISKTKPNSENTQKYEILFQKYKAVQKALEPIYSGEEI